MMTGNMRRNTLTELDFDAAMELARLSDEERRRRIQDLRRENRLQANELRVWWLDQMRNSPRPLQEKLTLF